MPRVLKNHFYFYQLGAATAEGLLNSRSPFKYEWKYLQPGKIINLGHEAMRPENSGDYENYVAAFSI